MNVTILHRDAFELLEKIRDEKGTSIYIDPPYLVKGAKYIHDFTCDDHVRLAETLSRFLQARIVVSYYDDPRLQDHYPGWAKHCIDVPKSTAHQNKRGANKARATEVLLVNSHFRSLGKLF
jgi:site-specific DNA-adenine methylase